MNQRNGEQGFLFIEAALLGLLLIAMTAFIVLPRHSAAVLRSEHGRTTALFLAEQELAELELRARNGELADGSYGWLGPQEDLHERQTAYDITGTVQKDGPRGYALSANISWQEGGEAKELRLERWVAKHDTP